MAGSFSWTNRGALAANIDRILANAQPNSTPSNRYKRRLLEIVREDNDRKLDDGVDNRGRKFAPLKASTLKRRGRGSGGPLNPTGSRFRTNFTAAWAGGGLDGKLVLACGFRDIPFANFHFTGTRRLPRRSLIGITRLAAIEVEKAGAQYVRDIAKYGG